MEVADKFGSLWIKCNEWFDDVKVGWRFFQLRTRKHIRCRMKYRSGHCLEFYCPSKNSGFAVLMSLFHSYQRDKDDKDLSSMLSLSSSKYTKAIWRQTLSFTVGIHHCPLTLHEIYWRKCWCLSSHKSMSVQLLSTLSSFTDPLRKIHLLLILNNE